MLVLCLDHVGRISAYVNSKLMLYRYRRISVVEHYAQEKGKVGNNTEQQMIGRLLHVHVTFPLIVADFADVELTYTYVGTFSTSHQQPTHFLLSFAGILVPVSRYNQQL